MNKYDRDKYVTILLCAIIVVVTITAAWLFSTEHTLSEQRHQISLLEQNIFDAAKDVREAGGEVALQSWVQDNLTLTSGSSTNTPNFNARVIEDTRALRIFMQDYISKDSEDYLKTRLRFVQTLNSSTHPMTPSKEVASKMLGIFFPQVDTSYEQQFNGFEMKRVWIEDIQMIPIDHDGSTVMYAGFFKYSGLDLITEVLVANSVFMIYTCDEAGRLFFVDCNLIYE